MLNTNMNVNPEIKTAYIVLSIRDMKAMLKAARADARTSSSHPGKAPGSFTRVIYADLVSTVGEDGVRRVKLNADGEAHIESHSFLNSAIRG